MREGLHLGGIHAMAVTIKNYGDADVCIVNLNNTGLDINFLSLQVKYYTE